MFEREGAKAEGLLLNWRLANETKSGIALIRDRAREREGAKAEDSVEENSVKPLVNLLTYSLINY